MDKVIVIGAKDISMLDSVLAHLPEQFKSLEVVTTESSNLPNGQVAIIPKDMLDKFDEINFNQATPITLPEYNVTNILRNLPDISNMSAIYKEQDRQERKYQRETMKNISRYHSNLYKKRF